MGFFFKFFFVFNYRRTAMGQKNSTCLACLKQLRPVYEKATTVFCYRDRTFPRDVYGAPCLNTIARVRASERELSDIYRGFGKKTVQDTFRNKVFEIPAVQMVAFLREMATAMLGELEA